MPLRPAQIDLGRAMMALEPIRGVNVMGYTVWDREKGGPANRTRYYTHYNAAKACARLNAVAGSMGRFYIKEL